MKRSIILLLLSLLLALNLSMNQAGEPEASIGTAEMMPDRSIVVMLRTQSADGMVGETRLVYPVGSIGYEELINHLDGIEPSQSRPVPLWPETTAFPDEP